MHEFPWIYKTHKIHHRLESHRIRKHELPYINETSHNVSTN